MLPDYMRTLSTCSDVIVCTQLLALGSGAFLQDHIAVSLSTFCLNTLLHPVLQRPREEPCSEQSRSGRRAYAKWGHEFKNPAPNIRKDNPRDRIPAPMRDFSIDSNYYPQYSRIFKTAIALPTVNETSGQKSLEHPHALEALLGILQLRGDLLDAVRSQKGVMLVTKAVFWKRPRGRWRSSCRVRMVTQQVSFACPCRFSQTQTAGHGWE